MVWGRAKLLHDDMWKLYNLSEWEDILDDVPLPKRQQVEGGIACVVLQVASDFDRRVITPFRSFPFKILNLVKEPCADPCQCRRDTCRDMLVTPDDQLPNTIVKIKLMFRDLIEEGARTGMISMRLWAPLFTLA
eukprot:6216454-Pyramimonas_sp.AAC.1